jgi:uncharacterized protein YdgA (DUF945 family)
LKKFAIFAVAAVALLFLALPPALGMLTESQVKARVAALDTSGVLKVAVRSYERGWFRSRARISLALAPQMIARLDALGAAAGMRPFAADLDRRLPIALEIAHGPLAVLDGVYFGWSKMVAQPDPGARNVAALEENLGVPHLFEFRGRTSFAGGVSFDASLPPVDIEAAGVHVAFTGATVTGSLVGQRLVSDSRLGGFELTSPPGAFTIRNVRAATDSELSSSSLVPGDATLSVEQLSIVDAARGASPVLEAASVKIASKVGLDRTATLLDLHATYDADSLFVYGTRVAETSVGVTLDKIELAALEAYLRAVQSTGPTDSNAELGLALEHGVAAGPSFMLDPLRFRIDGEPFTARLEVATNPAALPPAGWFDLDNPAAILPALRSTATLDVSKKLTREIAVLAIEMRYGDDGMSREQRRLLADAQAGLMLATLVGQEILEDTGETYHVEVRFADGALTLNGAALPFDLP